MVYFYVVYYRPIIILFERWKLQSEQYFTVGEGIKKYFLTQATFLSSERCFSIAENMVREQFGTRQCQYVVSKLSFIVI